MGIFAQLLVIPDAAKRQSGIHSHRRIGMNAVPILRELWLWIPGSRLLSRAPE
jgi:hypothetical protein